MLGSNLLDPARVPAAVEEHRLGIERAGGVFDRCVDGVDLVGGVSAKISDVVLIGSSSRGGSSVFTETLRYCAGLLHFQAEVNPFLVLGGLTFPFSGTASDALGAEHSSAAARASLDRFFAWDIGARARELGEAARQRLVRDLWFRLSLQWPTVDIELERVRDWTGDTLRELQSSFGWQPGLFPTAGLFHTLFLRRVHAAEPRVNPYYYDVSATQLERFCADVPLPSGSPSPCIIEEPPYVTVGPWHAAEAEELATKPLVIKTPSNAYRLPFLRALFPNARIRVIHLTRHPGASVNGLMDGWRYRGFYSHRVGIHGRTLAMAGYDDAEWWKFDLPPGWQAWVDRPLVEVCGFQWRSTHEALLADLGHPRADSDDYLRIRFEDAVGEPAARRLCFERVAEWLGVSIDAEFAAVIDAGLPPIMATTRPRLRRWFDNANELAPVLSDPAIRAMMHELGYDDEGIQERR